MELMTDRVCVMKPPEIPEVQGSESFQTGEHIHIRKETHPQLHEDRGSRTQTLPDLPYISLQLAVYLNPFSQLLSICLLCELP